MQHGIRDSLTLALLGALGLCGLGLYEAIPDTFEPVDVRPASVAPPEVERVASGRWVKIRGHAREHEIATVITIGGRGAADGNIVFRLEENRTIVVCTSHERRPEPESVQTFEGLLLHDDDPRQAELEDGWSCLSTHPPGFDATGTVYLLDGYRPRSRAVRLIVVFALVAFGLAASAALVRLRWRSGRS